MKYSEHLKFDRKASSLINDRISKGGFGICSTCEYFRYQRSTYKSECGWCDCFDWTQMRPNRTDPITHCDKYADKFSMPLQEMKQLAWTIDVKAKSKVKVGFQPSDKPAEVKPEDVEVVIKPPAEEVAHDDY